MGHFVLSGLAPPPHSSAGFLWKALDGFVGSGKHWEALEGSGRFLKTLEGSWCFWRDVKGYGTVSPRSALDLVLRWTSPLRIGCRLFRVDNGSHPPPIQHPPPIRRADRRTAPLGRAKNNIVVECTRRHKHDRASTLPTSNSFPGSFARRPCFQIHRNR